MKLGIITLTEGYNYGNKLQNYALLRYLQECNYGTVKTINNHISTMSTKDRVIIKLKSLVPTKKHFSYAKRRYKFRKFNRKYLDFTKKKLYSNTDNFTDIDVFICGSDQIWNPSYFSNIDPFVGKLKVWKKSISYAASFGVSKIDDSLADNFKKSLNYLQAISVREEQGQVICKELGFDNTEVNIDPTFLLSEDTWRNMISQPDIKLPDSYVVTYFLGDLSDRIDNYINTICKENALERVDLNSTKHLKYFSLDPFEFLFAISHSKLVLTDSFHASVFSIIFSKKFLVFRREMPEKSEMHSRIETLLNLFDLESHFFENYNEQLDSLHIDSIKIKEIIESQQSKTQSYFKRNLSEIKY